jgi:hypothetical protein
MCPPGPWVCHLYNFKFFRKFASVVDTAEKFIVDTGEQFFGPVIDTGNVTRMLLLELDS